MLGGGSSVVFDEGDGNEVERGVAIHSSFISNGGSSWYVIASQTDDTATSSWHLFVEAICANVS